MFAPGTDMHLTALHTAVAAAPTFTEEQSDLCSRVEDLPMVWLLGTTQADGLEWIPAAHLLYHLDQAGLPLLPDTKGLKGKG